MKTGLHRIPFKNKKYINKILFFDPTDFDNYCYIGYKFKIIIIFTEIGCLFKISFN